MNLFKRVVKSLFKSRPAPPSDDLGPTPPKFKNAAIKTMVGLGLVFNLKERRSTALTYNPEYDTTWDFYISMHVAGFGLMMAIEGGTEICAIALLEAIGVSRKLYGLFKSKNSGNSEVSGVVLNHNLKRLTRRERKEIERIRRISEEQADQADQADQAEQAIPMNSDIQRRQDYKKIVLVQSLARNLLNMGISIRVMYQVLGNIPDRFMRIMLQKDFSLFESCFLLLKTVGGMLLIPSNFIYNYFQLRQSFNVLTQGGENPLMGLVNYSVKADNLFLAKAKLGEIDGQYRREYEDLMDRGGAFTWDEIEAMEKQAQFLEDKIDGFAFGYSVLQVLDIHNEFSKRKNYVQLLLNFYETFFTQVHIETRNVRKNKTDALELQNGSSSEIASVPTSDTSVTASSEPTSLTKASESSTVAVAASAALMPALTLADATKAATASQSGQEPAQLPTSPPLVLSAAAANLSAAVKRERSNSLSADTKEIDALQPKTLKRKTKGKPDPTRENAPGLDLGNTLKPKTELPNFLQDVKKRVEKLEYLKKLRSFKQVPRKIIESEMQALANNLPEGKIIKLGGSKRSLTWRWNDYEYSINYETMHEELEYDGHKLIKNLNVMQAVYLCGWHEKDKENYITCQRRYPSLEEVLESLFRRPKV